MAIHPLNGIALFAGIGGLELGLSLFDSRIRTVCYVEGEAFAAATITEKMEKGILHEAPIWSDVNTFDGSKWRGKVDFISAGFPCQPFSNAGTRRGTEDTRWLWHEIIRIIDEVRPQFIFLENVAAFTSSKTGMSTVLRTLSESGYDAQWECFTAKQVGAPHKRNRFFLFAYPNSALREQEFKGMGLPKTAGMCRDVSDPHILKSRHKSNSRSDPQSKKKKQKTRAVNGSSLRTDVPDTLRQRLEGQRKISSRTESESSHAINEGWWTIEPSVGRVVDGLPNRVDRLRACGNGVVPLQAAYAFHVLSTKAGYKFGVD